MYISKYQQQVKEHNFDFFPYLLTCQFFLLDSTGIPIKLKHENTFKSIVESSKLPVSSRLNIK